MADLDRLLQELSFGVEARHIALLEQAYRLSRDGEEVCVQLKPRNHLGWIDQEDDDQVFLGDIYARTRGSMIDLRDLSNVAPRLQTYIGHLLSSTPRALPVGQWPD